MLALSTEDASPIISTLLVWLLDIKGDSGFVAIVKRAVVKSSKTMTNVECSKLTIIEICKPVVAISLN